MSRCRRVSNIKQNFLANSENDIFKKIFYFLNIVMSDDNWT